MRTVLDKGNTMPLSRQDHRGWEYTQERCSCIVEFLARIQDWTRDI